MKKDRTPSADTTGLRPRAEARLGVDKTEGATPTEKEALRLLHELQVHQIELEMQNEELRRSRAEVEAGLERYTELYDFAPVGYLTLGRDGAIRQVNLTGAGLLGVERARLVGRRLGVFVGEPDRAGLKTFMEKVFAGQTQAVCEVALLREGKGSLSVHITATVSPDGQECRAMLADITERKQIEHAQLFLQQCGWSTAGEDFFRALARYLAESLEMDYVRIDRLERDALAAKTVAVYRDGRFADNLTYTLKDAPCGDVVGKAVCSFPRDVRHLFPRDQVLQEMAAESYFGTTLWGSRGQPIGLIAVIGRRPRADFYLAEAILKVVAIRAAGELERSQTAAEMKRLASFPILNPNPIAEVDVAGHVRFSNPTAERVFPDLYQRGLGHPWLADWESMLRTLLEGGSQSMVREVSVGESWYQQTLHFVEDAQHVRIYGMDISVRKKVEEALQRAHDDLEKQVEERTVALKTALSEIKAMKDQLEAENIYFREKTELRGQFSNIIGQSDGLKYVLYRAEQVAPANTTVLILGETGTGKELIAAAIHNMSPRKKRPLITVNCAALPANLIESELFGREKGAFTGADTRQVGRFEIANGSTLCLDEIGELPLELQAKLLRAIQHGEFERLGSSHTATVDVRIVATTNRDLEEEVRPDRAPPAPY
jgi:PAS domain S-box-containing protein